MMNPKIFLWGLLIFLGLVQVTGGFQSISRISLSKTSSSSSSSNSCSPLAAQHPTTHLPMEMDRRSAIALALLGTALVLPSDPTYADDGLMGDMPPITHSVYMNVRISRQDGTFYVRDDLEDRPENRVFTGTLKLGLFGTLAPRAVQQFLSYVKVTYNPLDDDPLPSYSRSSFSALDQATGKYQTLLFYTMTGKLFNETTHIIKFLTVHTRSFNSRINS
jgi:hypothetical protein